MPTTPIARSKTAALSRVLDLIPKGYRHYTAGVCPVAKAASLASKFHERYGIACTPAQRITRKQRGEANALLVMYWPPEVTEVTWLLMATDGAGPIRDQEQLHAITDKRRLIWLGYELVQHTRRGSNSWTWRRPKAEMADLHALLGEQCNRRQWSAVEASLNRVARQPGFAGVRAQSFTLCQFALSRGYSGELPTLFYVQKIGHGDPLVL